MSPEPGQIKGFQLISNVLTRAASDDDFRRRLREDPRGVLREAGLEVDDETEFVVHENEGAVRHLVIPSRVVEWEELDIETVDAPLILESGF